jgi:hypothetical protein
LDFGEDLVSAFPNLRISHKLMAALTAVVAVIFVSSAILYDALRMIDSVGEHGGTDP